MWLTNLKIAVIEQNTDKLSKLMKDIPMLSNNKEREEAIYLLKQATEFVSKLKNETAQSMKKIQKSLNFLKSTEHKTSAKLDIRL